VASARRGRDVRLVSRCRVEFDRPSGRVVAETEDLSSRGLFIRTDSLLPIGESTKLLVELPNGTRLDLFGRVAHMLTPIAAKALGRHPGMGIELLGTETPDRIKLTAYVDSLKAETTNPGLSTTTQIILIEPNNGMRNRIGRALEAAGFQVTAVTNPAEAIEACEVWRPDAIVAPASMDQMSGTELAYAMSEHSTLSDVPLILTGDEGDLSRLEAYRAGVRDYIPKPFLDEELIIRVHRQAVPITAAGGFGLRGNLNDISLATLFSLFEFERKSGILLVLRDGDIARVFVADGRILKVETSGDAGSPKERLMGLLDWHDGQFEFSPAAIGGRDEVEVTITALLLEHARVADEAQGPRATPPEYVGDLI